MGKWKLSLGDVWKQLPTYHVRTPAIFPYDNLFSTRKVGTFLISNYRIRFTRLFRDLY